MVGKRELGELRKTSAFMRVHAHISGDGYLTTSKTKRCVKELLVHPRKNKIRNRYHTVYVNTEKVLVNEFVQDMWSVFKRKAVKHKNKPEYGVDAKWIYDLMKETGALDSKSWFVPKEILETTLANKKEWLRAFFDDEGHVAKKEKRIVLNIINEQGLKQIREMLSFFNIQSFLRGPYKNGDFWCYQLKIYSNNLVKYAERIGFSHPKKIRDLDLIIQGLEK